MISLDPLLASLVLGEEPLFSRWAMTSERDLGRFADVPSTAPIGGATDMPSTAPSPAGTDDFYDEPESWWERNKDNFNSGLLSSLVITVAFACFVFVCCTVPFQAVQSWMREEAETNVAQDKDKAGGRGRSGQCL